MKNEKSKSYENAENFNFVLGIGLGCQPLSTGWFHNTSKSKTMMVGANKHFKILQLSLLLTKHLFVHQFPFSKNSMHKSIEKFHAKIDFVVL